MDECISRNKAINAIKSLESSMPAKDNYAKGYDAALGRALIAVREVSPATDVQPIDRWISVKDSLPKNYIEVLVYDTDCGIVIGWYDKEIGDFVAEFISPLDAVTHWMPLPEPPKDGDAE
jgi:hypothetical protein